MALSAILIGARYGVVNAIYISELGHPRNSPNERVSYCRGIDRCLAALGKQNAIPELHNDRFRPRHPNSRRACPLPVGIIMQTRVPIYTYVRSYNVPRSPVTRTFFTLFQQTEWGNWLPEADVSRMNVYIYRITGATRISPRSKNLFLRVQVKRIFPERFEIYQKVSLSHPLSLRNERHALTQLSFCF